MNWHGKLINYLFSFELSSESKVENPDSNYVDKLVGERAREKKLVNCY